MANKKNSQEFLKIIDRELMKIPHIKGLRDFEGFKDFQLAHFASHVNRHLSNFLALAEDKLVENIDRAEEIKRNPIPYAGYRAIANKGYYRSVRKCLLDSRAIEPQHILLRHRSYAGHGIPEDFERLELAFMMIQ